ncbi:hypothetical protein L484_023082 [Morus notabilis]|uniref:Uncharacterized protein n=1 Tax=Morus notabilis TaxID=981085 RepID=W9RLP2_9ROSA|nr:hypothetical protein L484_023082 [Morus notabilis]
MDLAESKLIGQKASIFMHLTCNFLGTNGGGLRNHRVPELEKKGFGFRSPTDGKISEPTPTKCGIPWFSSPTDGVGRHHQAVFSGGFRSAPSAPLIFRLI